MGLDVLPPTVGRVLSTEVSRQVNRRIQAEIEQGESGASWLPSMVESVNELFLHEGLMESRLKSFRTLMMRGGGISWPDCPAPGFSWFSINPLNHMLIAFRHLRGLKRTFQAILSRNNLQWTEFQEDLIGSPYHSRSLLFLGRPETEANLRNSLYFGLLSGLVDFQRVSTVLEIGGGFGGLTGRMALMHPEKEFFLVELPFMSVAAYYYLNQKVGAQYLSDAPYELDQTRIRVMPPWVLRELDIQADLVINTMSFQHMNKSNLMYYFDLFRRSGVKQIFSVNREVPRNEGEAPYLEVAYENGFEVGARVPLVPWSNLHFVHILSKA